MSKYKFTPTFDEPVYKCESQDFAKKIEAGEAEWTQLGTYHRTLPGRKLNFKDHGEVLRIETQEEWDKLVADAEDEVFARMQHHENRICTEREIEDPLTMDSVDRWASWDLCESLSFEHKLNDIETNGKNSEMHQESLRHEEEGFYSKLNYFLRDDILTNEVNREFRFYRDGMCQGYKEALADAAYVEDQVPELRDIREGLRQETIANLRAYFIGQWGEDTLSDEIETSLSDYGKKLSIAQLVKTKESAKIGKF